MNFGRCMHCNAELCDSDIGPFCPMGCTILGRRPSFLEVNDTTTIQCTESGVLLATISDAQIDRIARRVVEILRTEKS